MKRKHKLMRSLALLSSGGSLFFFWGGSAAGCNALSQGALERYVQNVGNNAIAAATDGAGDPLIVEPTTQLFQEIWSTWVDIRFPGDQVYDRLLVE